LTRPVIERASARELNLLMVGRVKPGHDGYALLFFFSRFNFIHPT
jgi:hypothetical protein